MTESERKAVLDLLAIMHRDGGQYAAKHGIEKAARDASELWFLRAEHHSFTSGAMKERYESAERALRECCLLALRTLSRVTFGSFCDCEEEKALFRNTIRRLNEHEKVFKATLTEGLRKP
jgi:hypothetical protein